MNTPLYISDMWIRKTLGFNETDLQANADGRLSMAQRLNLVSRVVQLIVATVVVFIVGGTAIFFTAPGMEFNEPVVLDTPAAKTHLIVTSVILFAATYWVVGHTILGIILDVIWGRALSVEGRVESVSLRWLIQPQAQIKIDNAVINLSERSHQIGFRSNETYRVYYTRFARNVVAVKTLTGISLPEDIPGLNAISQTDMETVEHNRRGELTPDQDRYLQNLVSNTRNAFLQSLGICVLIYAFVTVWIFNIFPFLPYESSTRSEMGVATFAILNVVIIWIPPIFFYWFWRVRRDVRAGKIARIIGRLPINPNSQTILTIDNVSFAPFYWQRAFMPAVLNQGEKWEIHYLQKTKLPLSFFRIDPPMTVVGDSSQEATMSEEKSIIVDSSLTTDEFHTDSLLRTAFQFEQDDLLANSQGWLTDRQRALITKPTENSVGGWLMTIFCGLGWIALSLFLVESDDSVSLNGWVFGMLAIAIILTLYAIYGWGYRHLLPLRRELGRGEVNVAEGQLQDVPFVGIRMGHKFSVDSVEFHIKYQNMMQGFVTGARYRVYYLPETKIIVSAKTVSIMSEQELLEKFNQVTPSSLRIIEQNRAGKLTEDQAKQLGNYVRQLRYWRWITIMLVVAFFAFLAVITVTIAPSDRGVFVGFGVFFSILCGLFFIRREIRTSQFLMDWRERRIVTRQGAITVRNFMQTPHNFVVGLEDIALVFNSPTGEPIAKDGEIWEFNTFPRSKMVLSYMRIDPPLEVVEDEQA